MATMKYRDVMTLVTLKILIFVHDLKCWEIKLAFTKELFVKAWFLFKV